MTKVLRLRSSIRTFQSWSIFGPRGAALAVASVLSLRSWQKSFLVRVKVTKLNVDECPATPTQYGVRGIPTLILFKGGKILDQLVGAHPKARLKALIEKAL